MGHLHASVIAATSNVAATTVKGCSCDEAVVEHDLREGCLRIAFVLHCHDGCC